MPTVEKFYKIRVRKNDIVQIISGKDKGKTGKILLVDTKTGTVTVEGVNVVKKHVKPNQKNPQGGMVTREAPLHVSKVLLFSPSLNKAVRTEKGRKELQTIQSGAGTKAKAAKKKK